MLVFEAKLRGTDEQYVILDEMIRTARFVRNSCLRYWNRMVGIDVGLNHFYTDSDGNKVENPRFLRKSEKALKRAQKRVSRRTKGSKNRLKAIKQLGRTHLKVSRRRKDFAVKTARALVQSADLVAIEDLKVPNMVKNHHLKALQGLAQLPRGTRKVTPGDEMTRSLEEETPKSKVARRTRKPHQ